jgi:exonuclease VII small subunit
MVRRVPLVPFTVRAAAGVRRVLPMLLVAGVAACGGEDDGPRARVDEYMRGANAVQHQFAPDFERANDAYAAYARGELRPRRAEAELSGAERALREARADVAALRPPGEARALHAKLLRYLDMNVRFARETSRLAVYSPGADRALRPLDRANRGLSKRLADAGEPDAQASALESFARALERTLRDLRTLEVPAVLAPTHRDQVRRLASTRALAERLRRALVDQDAEEVARLLKRFRAGAAEPGGRRRLAAKGVRRYNRRYRALTEAYQDLQREQAKLDEALG